MTSIRVSDNGRYFIDEHGAPFFWLGDTQWDLFREFTVEDACAIMARRKAQGFSVLQVMATGVGEGDKPNLAGQTPWIGGDPSRPNEAYFAGMDAVVREAGRLGMILVVGIYHQVQADRLTMDNARAYARWIGRRYRDQPHLVWTMYPKAELSFLPVLRELAAGLREADAGQAAEGGHLITVHPDPAPTSSSFIHDEPWLAFNMSQPCVQYEKIIDMVRADHARTPAKPAVMAEGGYEGLEFGRLQTDLEIRRQAYWSHLAGGHHSYGHQDAWQNHNQWRTWIDSPGARHLGVYRQVLTSLPCWWEWETDQSMFVDDPGSGMAACIAARGCGGDWALAYIAEPRTIAVRMDRAAAGGRAAVCWIDPTTGGREPLGAYRPTGTRTFTVPGDWRDALVLLSRIR